MEINLGFVVLQFSQTQMLAFFWAGTVTLSFNVTYILFLWDRGVGSVTSARIIITAVIGTLVLVGTYADTLAGKPFALKDCLILAFVAAHGWAAEEFVQNWVNQAGVGRGPAVRSPIRLSV